MLCRELVCKPKKTNEEKILEDNVEVTIESFLKVNFNG